MCRRVLGWAAAPLAVGVLSGGCVWKLPFNHTGLLAPQFAPGNLGEVRVGGRCTVRVEHLTIRVSALGLGSSLLVVLNFESDVLGYSFDAMGTTVETANHAHVRPSGYVGPGEMTWHSDHNLRECVAPGRRAAGLERRSDATWHALPPRDTCFVLEFPTLVVPTAAAELRLGAVSQSSRPLPAIRFRLGEQALWSNVIAVQPVASEYGSRDSTR